MTATAVEDPQGAVTSSPLVLPLLTGTVVGLGMFAAGRGPVKYALPFGCFLAVGAAIAATAGPNLITWYLGLF